MLGEQIRNIRKSRDFTLKALAEQTGLSIGYISQIERNLTDPSLSTLRKISAALDVPTYLFMGEAEADNTLTTRKNQVITLSQPHSNIRYHLLTPMPSAEFVPQSLIIGFELEAHAKDGERPVIHPSEEIIMDPVRRTGCYHRNRENSPDGRGFDADSIQPSPYCGKHDRQANDRYFRIHTGHLVSIHTKS